jgi:oligopeptide/dipeptide ABC transporter ATP-binding protein
MTTDALTVRDLTIASAGGVLVRDVSFRLGRGRSLGIIGESGSGKTLTLRSLMSLLPTGVTVRGGTIEVDLDGTGPRVVADPAELCGRGFSMVFQDPLAALDPTMRVGDLVADVLTTIGGVERRDVRAAVARLFGEVGFHDPARIADSFPHQLSNGQRQRVVLAIALASNPAVLLCDEATSALDVTTQAQIVDLLNALRAERDLSLVFVTHDLAVARQTVDDVVVMFAGGIVEVGDIDSVLRSPRHPYTRSLIDAYSTGARDETGTAADGVVSASDRAAEQGCPFRRRCPLAAAECEGTMPTLDALTVRVGSVCLRDESRQELWGAA